VSDIATLPARTSSCQPSDQPLSAILPKNPAFSPRNSLFSDIEVAPLVGNLYYQYDRF
jgi:hypothetical protein